MHVIGPARLRPGAALLPAPAADASPSPSADGRLHGRALTLWDPTSGGTKKLEAIDTDQITPASDCVSERLDTLDERWNAGSFRYLMPDFRARVHAGETFVVAGDRSP